jgi:hypothetical protein
MLFASIARLAAAEGQAARARTLGERSVREHWAEGTTRRR